MHVWEFLLKNNYNKIELWDSKLSGKKKLVVNGKTIVDIQNSCAIFNYSFQLSSYYFNVVQLDDKYDIKINNNYFKDIIQYEISGDLKGAKIERESKKDNSENNILFGQSLNAFKFENENHYNEEKFSKKIKAL